MHEHQYNDIAQFQKETFPQSTALSKTKHLAKEVVELMDDIETNSPHARLEFADCFILLMGAAHAHGMSYFDVMAAIEEKMAINRTRTWGTPDKDGVVLHNK